MTDFVQANRTNAKVPDDEGASGVHQIKAGAAAPGNTAAAQALNRSARVEPLTRLRQALDQSPRVQSQVALQRALNAAPDSGHEISGGGVLARAENSLSGDGSPAQGDVLQARNVFGANQTLESGDGNVHYHYLYDDTDINSMHVTFADNRNYNNRTWASRSSYTPTGYDWQENAPIGDWDDLDTQLGEMPEWATNVINENLAAAQNSALEAYTADQNIRTRLRNQYPQPEPDIDDEDEFPRLGG